MDPDQLRQILKEELKPIIDTQKDQGKVLSEHSQILAKQGKVQEQQGKILQEQGEKLDALTVEVHQVHQLANVTVDVVVARYEKNKREIDEIKDHLSLTKEPYFGESN